MAAGFVCVFLLLLDGTGGVSPVVGLQNHLVSGLGSCRRAFWRCRVNGLGLLHLES